MDGGSGYETMAIMAVLSKHAASADNAGSGGGRNSVSAGMGRPPAHQAVQWLHRDRCNDGEVPPLLVS